MAARCDDEQASVMRRDADGGYEETPQHCGRQREHKEPGLITAAVNRHH